LSYIRCCSPWRYTCLNRIRLKPISRCGILYPKSCNIDWNIASILYSYVKLAAYQAKCCYPEIFSLLVIPLLVRGQKCLAIIVKQVHTVCYITYASCNRYYRKYSTYYCAYSSSFGYGGIT